MKYILHKIVFFFHDLCPLLKNSQKQTNKKSFAYLALAFKVVWHTPFKTFKGGDPNNAFHLTANGFSLLFINESFG